MKQLVKNYSFDKTAKTVTFTDFSTVLLERILLITDVTAGVIVFQFNDNTLGGSVSGNVLTLTYNTSALANTDKLQIIYDAATGDPIYDASASTSSVGNVAAGATDSGNPVKIGGKYNAASPTLTDGQRGDLQLDSSGNAKVYLATKLDSTNDSITAYPFGHSYQNISTNATTTVKASAGTLIGMIVGDPGSSWQAVIYDNTTGTGTIIATIKFSTAGFINMGPLAFVTGVTIVTSGTTPGNITPIWR